MRVLVFHGYLLRGTGSNVYNANLARAIAHLGHDVHLLCQDRDAAESGWAGDAAITLHIPDIGGLLPVYVRDRYQGFDVKELPELSEAELERYLEANVSAVREVVASVGGVDAALANHLVMGPAILARAGLGTHAGGPGFAVKIHGSALEYTVKPNAERFLPYAREGVEAASGILVGSRHTAESLWETLGDPALADRTRLGPPGVDVDAFSPASSPTEATADARALAADLRKSAVGALGREPAAGADAIASWASATGPRVVFVGKLIVSKGLDLLLAAWPLVVAANPGARLLIVAFGELREAIERVVAGMAAGDLAPLRELADRGRALEGGAASSLPLLAAFLAAVPRGYADAARNTAGSILIAGRLEHEEVARLLPAAEALVMPSTFPESFGMVAAEAAAAGVLPVSAGHSGMLEVTTQLAGALPDGAAELVSFQVEPGAVEAIAERLNRWLALDQGTRDRAREALVSTARRLWSWDGVARGVLAASAGDLDELPPVYE